MAKENAMLEVFFDCQGVVHYKFIPEGKNVNKEMHIDFLRRLRNAFRRKRLEKRRPNSWFLLHENAAVHRSVLVKDFLAKTMWQQWIISHTLMTGHQNFYLFPILKITLKE